MQVFTYIVMFLVLIIMAILIANVKILTAKEVNNHSKADINKSEKIIMWNFIALLSLGLLAFLIT